MNFILIYNNKFDIILTMRSHDTSQLYDGF